MATITLSVADQAGFDTANFFPSDLQFKFSGAGQSLSERGYLYFYRYVDGVVNDNVEYKLEMNGSNMQLGNYF